MSWLKWKNSRSSLRSAHRIHPYCFGSMHCAMIPVSVGVGVGVGVDGAGVAAFADWPADLASSADADVAASEAATATNAGLRSALPEVPANRNVTRSPTRGALVCSGARSAPVKEISLLSPCSSNRMRPPYPPDTPPLPSRAAPMSDRSTTPANTSAPTFSSAGGGFGGSLETFAAMGRESRLPFPSATVNFTLSPMLSTSLTRVHVVAADSGLSPAAEVSASLPSSSLRAEVFPVVAGGATCICVT